MTSFPCLYLESNLLADRGWAFTCCLVQLLAGLAGSRETSKYTRGRRRSKQLTGDQLFFWLWLAGEPFLCCNFVATI